MQKTTGRRILGALLAVALCLPVVAAGDEDTHFDYSKLGAPAGSADTAGEGQPAAVDQQSAEPVWTYPISMDILRDELDVIQLVNRSNLLTKDYPPSDELHKLVDISVPKKTNVEMLSRVIASDALTAFFAAAEEAGYSLVVQSAYRSYGGQASTYARYIERVGKDDGYSQPPGASEHQTGLAFDVTSKAWARDEEYLNKRFAQTAEGQWMAANCARFGFIIRYAEDKEEITGINYEPWHLRYVGVEVAQYMTENNLSLEEFTAQWRDALGQYAIQIGDPSIMSAFSGQR